MYIEESIIKDMLDGNTPPLIHKLGDSMYSDRYDSGLKAIMEFEDRVYRDIEGYGIDYNSWENQIIKVGRTYKVQRIGERSGMGLSFIVTDIKDCGTYAEIHYSMLEDQS